MGGVVKRQDESIKTVVTDNRKMLLVGIESRTSKEVRDACENIMDEELLKRTARMSERLAENGIKPNNAALAIAQMAENWKICPELFRIVDEFVDLPKQLTGCIDEIERMSRKASPETVLHSIFVVRWLFGKKTEKSSMQNFDGKEFLQSLSKVAESAGTDRFHVVPALCIDCMERGIDPVGLLSVLTVISRKQVTKEHFAEVAVHLEKILENSEIERSLGGNLDAFLSTIAERAEASQPMEVMKLIAAKEKEMDFKKWVVNCAHGVPAGVAVALRFYEDDEFRSFISKAFYEREGNGYKALRCPSIEIHPIRMLNEIHSLKGGPTKSEQLAMRDFPRLKERDVGYREYKEVASSSEHVREEMKALGHLLKHHREDLWRRMTLLTHCQDIENGEAEECIMQFLKIAKEREFFRDGISFGDVGTASGKFTNKPIIYLLSNFEKHRIVRTNAIAQKVDYHPKLEVREYDAIHGSLEEEFDILIVKDVMKFLKEDPRGKVWKNIAECVKEGGVAISGCQENFKVHVKHDGKLVRVDPILFLEEWDTAKSYESYLAKLDEIVGKCRYDRSEAG